MIADVETLLQEALWIGLDYTDRLRVGELRDVVRRADQEEFRPRTLV